MFFVSSTPPQSFIGFLVFLIVVFLYHPASSLLPNLPPSPSRKVSVVLFPHNSTHLLQTFSEVVEGEGEGRGGGGEGRGEEEVRGEGRRRGGRRERARGAKWKESLACCPVHVHVHVHVLSVQICTLQFCPESILRQSCWWSCRVVRLSPPSNH